MRQGLVHPDNVLVSPGNVFEIAGIAHARQFGLLLVRTQPGEIVLVLLIETLQVTLCLVGDRSIGKKLLQQRWWALDGVITLTASARTRVDDQLVRAERFLVEKDFRAHALRAVQV